MCQLLNVKPADRSLFELRQLITNHLYLFNLNVSICEVNALYNRMSFVYHSEEVY